MIMSCRMCFASWIIPASVFALNFLCGCGTESLDCILDDLQGADKSYPVFRPTESEPSFVGGMCVGYCSIPDIREYDIDTSSVTNIREIMRIELCREFSEIPGDLDNQIKIAAAKDVPHALSLFDAYILPSLEDRSDARIKKLRRLIEEGRSWIYCRTDIEGYLGFFFLNLFPSCDSGEYGFAYLEFYWDKATRRADIDVERYGHLRLRPQFPYLRCHYSNSCYEDYCARLPRIYDTLDAREYEVLDDPYRIDVAAIVEVVDVQLIGVTGFNYSRNHYNDYPGTRAEYHIRLDVRKVEKGELSSDICVLECRQFRREFESWAWPYYPGVTLRVGLQYYNGKLHLIEQSIVEPYPPYSDAGVSVSGGRMIRGPNGLCDDQEGRLEPLVVNYGSHTKVEFRHGDIITSGVRATFADFGVTSKFRILELNDGANKAYWESVWYTPKDQCLGSRLHKDDSVRTAHEGGSN